MDKSVLLMLLGFSGLSILPSCLSFHYKYVEERKNWTEAQSYCRENYTDLATLYDRATNPMKDYPQDKAWIGLSNGFWKWSLDDQMLNHSYTDFNLMSKANSNSDEKNNCVKINDNHWNTISCSDTIPFICYDRDCTNKYICIGESKTWDESQNYCRANHTDLASVRNETEKTAVMGALNYELCQNEFWIGLSRVKWQWSDQSDFHIQNWEGGEPNGGDTEKCVEMCVETGKWDDESCDDTKPFICYDDDLVLVRENKTWVEALNHCRQQGWDLVSIHSERIQHWVQRRARNATTPYVWLGLRYTCALKVWFWVSEHGLCHQNWAPDHGSNWEECKKSGAMPREGPQQWEGMNQAEKLNFICTKTPDEY